MAAGQNTLNHIIKAVEILSTAFFVVYAFERCGSGWRVVTP